MQEVEIEAVKYNESNPRFINDEDLERLKKSLQDFPEMLKLRPVVINNENVVLGGNMRLKALYELGYKKIPVAYASDLTEEKQAEFVIKDNVGLGSWDWNRLANEWDDQKLIDWGLDVDFSNGTEKEAEEDDYEAPDEVQTNIQIGDLIEIGEHRLLCGDSTDTNQVAKLMYGGKADMVFTDPPHDIEQPVIVSFLDQFAKHTKFILHNDLFLAKLANNYKERFERFFVHDFIFHIGGGNRFYTQNDLIACFDYSNDRYFNKEDGFSTIVRKMTERQKGSNNLEHSQQKPVYLVSEFIKHFSKESEVVLDLYLGSGTTMLSCQQLNRKCYGMELDPNYCQVIVDRMKNSFPKIEVKINGKEYNG
jgi:hypothetical protein